MKQKIKFIFLLALLFVRIIEAQEMESQISIISFRTDDSIILFWNPSKHAALLECTRAGYLLERYELSTNSISKIESTKKSWNINPSSDSEVYSYLTDSEKYQEISALSLAEQDDALKSFYTITMMAAYSQPQFANKLGLRFVDKSIEKSKSYYYKVIVNNLSQKFNCLGTVAIENNELPIVTINEILEEEKFVRLTWLKKKYKNYYTGFYMERSKDNIHFQKVDNGKLFIGMHTEDFESDEYVFFDSLALYTPHYYRIIGLSPFGLQSKPSESIQLMCRDRTGPKAPDKLIHLWNGDTTLVLRWNQDPASDLKGYDVQRCKKLSNDSWETLNDDILLNGTNSFYHSGADRINPWFYRVVAYDTSGNYSVSEFHQVLRLDSVPPSKPKGLKGSIDSLGQVLLTWDANPEEDLNGYYIYFSNKRTHMFKSLVGYPIKTNSFKDTITLKTHTEEIYYRIAAVDFVSNYSTYSEILELKKPDIIPPSPPILYNQIQMKDGIHLFWHPSAADDVESYLVYRMTDGKDWIFIKSLPKDQMNYIDVEIKPDSIYFYKIHAKDDAGLLSDAPISVSIKTFVMSEIENVENLTAVFNKDQWKVKLNWDGPKNCKYAILKSIDENPLVTIAYIDSSKDQYEDGDIRSGTKYNYAIKAITPNQTKLSSTTTIKISKK